ncbi:MAG: hypothetical protein JXR88_16855 [Clostridia bacterium]|nr:hypothetical protein [Clostridia bacterium]
MEAKLMKWVALMMIVLLLVPLISVSCMDEEYVKLNSLNLGLGLDKKVENPISGEKEKIEIEHLASGFILIVVVITGAAVVWSGLDNKFFLLLKLGIYSLGILSLLWLPLQVSGKLKEDASMKDYLSFNLEAGYYLMLILFVGMILGLLLVLKRSRAKLPLESNDLGSNPLD